MKMIAEGISSKLNATAKQNVRDNIGFDAGILKYNQFMQSLLKKATLWLDFVNNEHRVYEQYGLTTKLITDAITTARNSTATYDAPTGIATAAINLPRIKYDPVTGQCLGLLVEEARTNLLLNSQLAGASGETLPTSWTSTETTGVTTTQASSRFAGAIRITATGTAQRENIFQTVTLAAATTYTLSAYFAAGTVATDTVMRVTTSDTPTGTLTLAGSAITAAGIYSITFTTVAGGSYAFRIGLGCTGNATGTVIHETPQLEVGTFPSSHIPTTTAALARFNDTVSKTVAAHTEGTIICVCSGGSAVAGINQAVFTLSDGTTNNRIVLRRNNAVAGSQHVVISGGTSVAQANTTVKTNGQRTVFAFSWKENQFLSAEDGVVVLNDTSGATPVNMTQLGIGNSGPAFSGAESINGTIEMIAMIPRALTVAELQQVKL